MKLKQVQFFNQYFYSKIVWYSLRTFEKKARWEYMEKKSRWIQEEIQIASIPCIVACIWNFSISFSLNRMKSNFSQEK